MTQTANNYGTVLFELGITKEIVEKTKEIFELTSELPRVLNCPVVSRKEKHRMIERFFPQARFFTYWLNGVTNGG